MSAPIPSKLDQQQVLQGSFDEAAGALRVEGTLGGAIEVVISSTTDSIAIGNANNEYQLLVNPDGSINIKLETSSIEIGKVDQGAAGTSSWLVDVTNIVPVSQSGIWNVGLNSSTNNIGSISNITGTVSLPTGASTSANQTINNSTLTTISGQLPTTLGAKTTANSLAVNIASDQIESPTSTITRVTSSTTNVSLLASNTSRKAAYLFNESTSIAYVKLGITASTTSYTLQMVPNSFIVLSQWPIYTGEIDAIWLAVNGAMQITELT